MKLNLSPDEFIDFIILFLLDIMTNKDMLVLKTSSKAQAISSKFKSLGIKSILMLLFFTVDANLRTRYKQVRDVFDKKSSNQHSIYISQDANYLKKINNKKEVSAVKKAISTTIKTLNAGKDINPRNLQLIQEKVIKILEQQGDL